MRVFGVLTAFVYGINVRAAGRSRGDRLDSSGTVASGTCSSGSRSSRVVVFSGDNNNSSSSSSGSRSSRVVVFSGDNRSNGRGNSGSNSSNSGVVALS